MKRIYQLIGGAGTGKTSRNMQSIADLVADGVDPMEILFSSFTKAARLTAANRAEAITGVASNELISNGWFKTLQAVCYKCLGVKSNQMITDQKESREWLAKLYGCDFSKATIETLDGYSLEDNHSENEITKVLEEWSTARMMLKTSSDIDWPVRSMDRDDAIRVIEQYERRKYIDDRLDFADLALKFVGMKHNITGLKIEKPECEANQTPASAEIEEARAMCRAGNPFPLIALQWPEFVVKGPECRFFEGVEGDKVNPCLRFDWWQRLIFTAFFDPIYPEIFVKGCTGPGKGACVAIAVCLDFDVRDVAMWNITADTNKHASEVMFGEIMMWRKKMESPCYARELATAILANERKFITVLNPEKSSNGESFSGRHGSKYIFDESSSVPDVFYENACKNATKIVCISNPRTKVGFFRAGFRGLKSENKTGVTMGILGKRLCVTIGGLDCSNVKHERIKDPKSPVGGITIQGVEYPEGELIADDHFQQVKALIPGQMDLNQYRSILKNAVEKWKKQCFALGMFPDEDPVLQFIMQSWLTKQFLYHDNNYLDIEVNSFGLDVARSLDGDDTTLACGSWGGVRDIHRFKLDTYPKIADRVIGIVGDYGVNLLDGTSPICIDYGGGYGSGVGDWISPLGAWVIPQIPGGRAEVVPELYQNQRTEDYALLSLRLDPTREWVDQPFGLPNESNLSEELLAVTKVWDKAMTRFGTMPKEAMKLAFQDGRSPDSGDSVALMFRAVRALEDMDGMLRSSVVSGELIVSHAGQNRSNESAGAVSRKANEVIDDLLGYYKERNRR